MDGNSSPITGNSSTLDSVSNDTYAHVEEKVDTKGKRGNFSSNFKFTTMRSILKNCSHRYVEQRMSIMHKGKIEMNVKRELMETWKGDGAAKCIEDGSLRIVKNELIKWLNVKFDICLNANTFITLKPIKISDENYIIKVITKDKKTASSILEGRKKVFDKRGGINWFLPIANDYRSRLNELLKRKIITNWYITRKSAQISLVHKSGNNEKYYLIKNELEIDIILVNFDKIPNVIDRLACNELMDITNDGIIKN